MVLIRDEEGSCRSILRSGMVGNPVLDYVSSKRFRISWSMGSLWKALFLCIHIEHTVSTVFYKACALVRSAPA